MHMADALLTPAVAGSMYVLSGVSAGYAVRRAGRTERPEQIPVMGVLGSFVFAAQMVNFSIPGTGASGHLCGSMLLAAVLGPEAAFLTMTAILLIQCLLFADGGLMALGANLWNMAFYGCFVGGYLIWKNITGREMSKKRIIAASFLGCVLTMQLGAFSVVVETVLSGVTELKFSAFAAFMLPIHLAIGLAEGGITAAVLLFLYKTGPHLLWGNRAEEKERKMTAQKLVVLFALLAVLTGGVLSLLASARPDGLEWSLEKADAALQREAVGKAAETAQKMQGMTAILPDYALPGSDAQAGTSLSGLVGAAAVLLLCAVFCRILRLFRKKKVKQEHEQIS